MKVFKITGAEKGLSMELKLQLSTGQMAKTSVDTILIRRQDRGQPPARRAKRMMYIAVWVQVYLKPEPTERHKSLCSLPARLALKEHEIGLTSSHFPDRVQ